MTWRKAGYAEGSLRALHDRGVSSAGGGVSALRLALVGALDRLSGSQIPLSVNVSRLLDDTLDYLNGEGYIYATIDDDHFKALDI